MLYYDNNNYEHFLRVARDPKANLISTIQVLRFNSTFLKIKIIYDFLRSECFDLHINYTIQFNKQWKSNDL